MTIRRWLLALALCLAPVCSAQLVQLNGTIANSDGTPFNGTAVLSLARSTVTNICTTPVQVVPFTPVQVAVKNGVFTLTSVYATDCLAPRLPYYVTLKDSSGGTVMTDNWYVPQTATGTVNVGNLSTVRMATAINVAVPQAIISTPPAAQAITQPTGTYLTVNNLQVTNSLVYGGASLSLSGLTSTTATINNLTSSTASIGTLTVTGNSTLSGTLNVTGNTTLGTASVGDLFATNLASGFMVCTKAGGELAVTGCPGIGSIYYQKVLNSAGSQLPQETNLKFGPEFSTTDNSGTVATVVDLAPTTVTAGTYSYPTLVVNQFGQITSISSNSPSSYQSGSNVFGYWQKDPTGLIRQWGRVTTDINNGQIGVSFPTNFTNASSVTVIVSTYSPTDRITYVVYGSIGVSGFSIGNNGSSGYATWMAIGY